MDPPKKIASGLDHKFPCALYYSVVLIEKYPLIFSVTLTCTVGGASNIVLVLEILPLAVLAPVLLAVLALGLLFVWLGYAIKQGQITGELLEFNEVTDIKGHSHISTAKREAIISFMVGAVFSGVVLSFHIFLVQPKMDRGEDMILSKTFTLVNDAITFCLIGPVVTSVLGSVTHFRMIGRLLGDAVEKHFGIVRNTLFPEENTEAALDAKAVLWALDDVNRHTRELFAKVNRLVTRKVLGIVILALMISLALMLILVVKIRNEGFDNAGVIAIICVSLYCLVIGTGSLVSLTDVAERYAGCAFDQSNDIKLRYHMSKLLPGPAGVNLLTAFQKEYVNELSFCIHHNAIDRAVLENTLFRLALGALLTISLGIVQG